MCGQPFGNPVGAYPIHSFSASITKYDKCSPLLVILFFQWPIKFPCIIFTVCWWFQNCVSTHNLHLLLCVTGILDSNGEIWTHRLQKLSFSFVFSHTVLLLQTHDWEEYHRVPPRLRISWPLMVAIVSFLQGQGVWDCIHAPPSSTKQTESVKQTKHINLRGKSAGRLRKYEGQIYQNNIYIYMNKILK